MTTSSSPPPPPTAAVSSCSTSSSTTTNTTNAVCPICLDDLHPSEQVYEIPCEGCGGRDSPDGEENNNNYNYCSNCIMNFCQAADDDWGVASDGSRQVKVTIKCPKCRTKYPMDLRQIMLLRKAYMLATRLVDPGTGTLQQDSNLTASELRYKRDLMSSSSSSSSSCSLRTQLNDAQIIYDHVYWKGKKNNKAGNNQKSSSSSGSKDSSSLKDEMKQKQLEDATKLWKDLLSKLSIDDDGDENDENETGTADISSSVDAKALLPPPTIGTSQSNDSQLSSGSNGGSGSLNNNKYNNKKNKMVDETLFQGLDEFMNRDEQLFLTDLLTSNDPKLVAQAAMIMHGMLRLSWSGKHVASAKQQSKYESQKHIDYITRTKTMFPLPNHMPGYVLIPAFSKHQGYMLTKDVQAWDGTMEPPQQSKRTFDQVYRNHYVPPSPDERRNVVSISSIRGPVGRVGLRKNDRITHVNDMPWDGTAQELMEYIYDCYSRHPNDEISITVNADVETARFLHTRYNMMKTSRQQQAAAAAKKNAATTTKR